MKPSRFTAPPLLAATLLCASLAHADDRLFESLSNQKVDDAEGELYARGYRNIGIEKEHGDTLRYYWNADSRDCGLMSARDGRVRQVTRVSRTVCASLESGAASHGKDRYEDGPLPREITGLVGNKRDDAEAKLAKQGYRKLDGERSSGSTIGLWWNSSTRECLGVEAQDGRIRRIEREPRTTCD